MIERSHCNEAFDASLNNVKDVFFNNTQCKSNSYLDTLSL